MPRRLRGRRGGSQEEEPQPAKTHVVICVSMKMRMKTSTAGSALATIIHTGKAWLLPRGLITQPRWLGDVTEKPLGTDSFWRGRAGEKSWAGGAEEKRKGASGRVAAPPELVKGRAGGISGQGAAWLYLPRRGPEGDPGTPSYLRVSVLDAGIQQDHKEDGDGHAKVSDHPPHLPGEICSAVGNSSPSSAQSAGSL